MEYALRRMTLGGGPSIPIDVARYNSLSTSRNEILEAQFIEEKFDLVIEDYLEFENTLLEMTSRFMALGSGGAQSHNSERGLVNRRLVNLLSAARVFVDHSKQHFNSIHQSDQALKAELVVRFNEQYDTLLPYRALEALRNYVQHRGFPVHSMSYSSGVVQVGFGERFRHIVTAYLEPESLREDGKFKASVLDELEATGQKIDLRQLIRGYVQGLWRVNSWIRATNSVRIEAAEVLFRECIEEFRTFGGGQSVTALAAVKMETPPQVIGRVELFESFFEFRRYLVTKNANLDTLMYRFLVND